MKFRKRNINKDLNLSLLNRILALFILITTTLGYYGFFYICRESIRLLSISRDYEIWILSSEEVFFFNSFFAAISLIQGVSSSLIFLSNRPNSFGRSVRSRCNVVNDNRVLNSVFLMWGPKIASVMGIFFLSSRSYYETSLYLEYRYLLVLIVVVLYLQMWTTLRRIYPSVMRRWSIPFLIMFIMLSMLIGKINLIDHQSINQSILDLDPYQQLELNTPQSEYYTYDYRYGSNRQLFLGYKNDDTSSQPQLMSEGAEIIDLDYVDSIAVDLKSRINKGVPGFQLHIDTSVLMKHVQELKDVIASARIVQVGYSVVPKGVTGVSQLRYKRAVIPGELIDHAYFDYLLNMLGDQLQVYAIPIGDNVFKLNDKETPFTILEDEILNIISNDSTYLFKIQYKETDSYGDFIKLYSTIYATIINQRDQYSNHHFGKPYEWLPRKDRKKVRERFPMNVVDWGSR